MRKKIKIKSNKLIILYKCPSLYFKLQINSLMKRDILLISRLPTIPTSIFNNELIDVMIMYYLILHMK